MEAMFYDNKYHLIIIHWNAQLRWFFEHSALSSVLNYSVILKYEIEFIYISIDRVTHHTHKWILANKIPPLSVLYNLSRYRNFDSGRI